MSMHLFKVSRRRGVSLTGYALIVGLIAVVAISATTTIGSQVDTLFTDVSDNLDGVAQVSGSSGGTGTPAQPGPTATPSPTPVTLSGSGSSGSPFQWADGAVETTCAGYLAAATPYDYAGAPGGDGIYQIDPDGTGGTASFPVHCDMSTDGGGWTRLGYQAGRYNGIGASSYASALNGGTIMQNWTGSSTTLAGSASVPAGYLSSAHYLMLAALSDVSFSEMLLDDGQQRVAVDAGSGTTLNSVFNPSGGPSSQVLTRNGSNYGLMVLQGAPGQTSSTPCYYLNSTGTACESVFTGDTGNRTAFFLVILHGNCTFTSTTTSIWGSSDCYATDQYGGTFGTQVFRELGGNARTSGGRNGSAIELLIR